MSAGRRLIGFILLTLLVGFISRWVTHEWLRSQPTPHDLGLRWLKEEFHLTEESYKEVASIHEDYFRRCEDMCKKLDAATRPLLWRTRGRAAMEHPSKAEADRQAERALCKDCESEMVSHLQRVATLMPEEEGSRFLKLILPEVIEQHRQHDNRVTSLMQK
jgi:hypothetical protein